MSEFESGLETPGAATPAPESTPATPSASPAATPAIPAVTATPADDRSNWVPPHRLRETRDSAIREANQQWQQREAQVTARYQELERKFQALAGVTPPANPEVEQVRNQFGQLYPGLSKIEERAQDILGILDRANDLESQNSHYWTSYGRQTMDRLFEHASKELGSPLTDEGKRALHSAFTGFVSSSPATTERYANDPTLVEEFWKVFASSFISPARRAASATVAGRATSALPQDTPGGAPRATPAPKLDGLDERTAAAWTQYKAITNT